MSLHYPSFHGSTRGPHVPGTPDGSTGANRPYLSRRSVFVSGMLAALACSLAGAQTAGPGTRATAGGAGGAPASAAAPSAPPESVRQLLDWSLSTRDAPGRHIVIVDKRLARVFVFDPSGRPIGNAPALLGSASGDDSVPGIGERPLSLIAPHERTTPAGRFIAEPGVNAQGEDIVWVDYDSAVSMHRVRARVKSERRLERLASPTPQDNRISYGCINLPARFYEQVLRPAARSRKGAVIYVLPEVRDPADVFGWKRAPGAREAARRPENV